MHPVDEALRCLPTSAGPGDRLEAIFAAYEACTGTSLRRPLTEQARREVAVWLRQEHAFGSLILLRKQAFSSRPASATVIEKASYLQQHWCHECEALDLHGNEGLYHFTPINVNPWSAQSKGSRANLRIKELVQKDLQNRIGRHLNREARLCVCIVSLVPRSGHTKDVDNLVKGLLDSMTEVFWEDDRQVQCLTSRRIEYAGTDGLYLTAVRTVRPWEEDVVWDEPGPPAVLSGVRLDLD